MSAPVPGPVLATVPTYLRSQADLDTTVTCLVSLWGTTQGLADVLVVDDGSPDPGGLLAQLAAVCDELGFELHAKEENEGFSRAVNVGLRRALAEGRDAVLVNADMEFPDPVWLPAMLARSDTKGDPAAVVGALLLFPNGLIQHAGVIFSDLTRGFDHRFAHGPGNLPEALEPTRCPVTGALQLIRHECLAAVGIYDEEFRMGWEDVDYCLRVFASGRECIYEPAAVATHHEGLFRRQQQVGQVKEWRDAGARLLIAKYRTHDSSAWVTPLS